MAQSVIIDENDRIYLNWKGAGTVDTKAKAAYDYISSRIETGEFPPGMMLVERQLCEQLGISRSPVRTALTRLANEGELVQYVPKAGMRVSELSRKDVRELYDLRSILDGAAVARFTERATGQEVVAACRLFERMKSCLQAGDVEGLVNYDVLFHRYYTARCGNERLSEMFGHLFSPLRRFRWEIVQLGEEKMAQLMELHERLAGAIRMRDSAAASRYETESNELMCRWHLEWLDTQEAAE